LSRTSRRPAALVAAVGALVLAGAGPASAAPVPPNGSHEGLVRATLAANPGSVRLGANTIQLDPGLVMTLPGKRDSASARQARGIRCNYLYFCLYEHANWGGAALGMSACKVYILSSYLFWNGTEHQWDDWAHDASSWVNNQSGGARATMWKDNGLRLWVPVASDDHMIPGWNDRVVRAKPC
jgi:hypothetical protein